MRNYGVIHARYWTWALEHNLSDEAKVIGAYYLSCEHSNSAGCYRIPMEYVSADLGYPIDRVSIGYRYLNRLGFIAYCERSKWAILPKYLKWNPLQNKNHAVGAKRLLSQIPSSFTLRDILLESLQLYGQPYFTDKMIKNLNDTLCDTLSIGYRNGVETKDQDQDQDKEDIPPPIPPQGSESKSAPKSNAQFKVPTGKELWLSTSPWINAGAWDQFVQHRIDIKHKLTELAVTKSLNLLERYDYDTQQEIVDKTIRQNYRGLFEPQANGRQDDKSKQKRIIEKYEDKYGNGGSGKADRQDAVNDGALF